MFEKSLQDLVKGIRAHKKDTGTFISQCIADSKNELKSADLFVKSNALQKLTYLQMLGYDVEWASFHIVEVMSSPRFVQKRIGYLAACQTFTQETEVVLLCTNLLKKEFSSKNVYESGLAINCIANITTKDIARDLLGDMANLLGHSRPYTRKKAILALYKMFLRYPQGLRLTFDRLKEKMDDPDPSVVSCAVNVICELARKKPSNYLNLAPQFFRLLTSSSNNWMLIKVVKLLGSLVSEEPRLARKLLEPLATIIQNTPAKSLLYECIYTVTQALPYTKRSDGSDPKNVAPVVQLCSDQLRSFIDDPDQNLKYLGLVGLVNLMKSQPRVVAEHRDLVLRCLSDDDVTIRMRALELLTGMVTRRNLMDLVKKLMENVDSAEGVYKDVLVSKIIYICSRDKFAYLTDASWYVKILVSLAHVQGSTHGGLVAMQLVDLTVRVESVRPVAVRACLPMLNDMSALEGHERSTMEEFLYAAAWIIGEYADIVPEASEGDDDDEDSPPEKELYDGVIMTLLDKQNLALPSHVQAVYIQGVLKVLSAMVSSIVESVKSGDLDVEEGKKAILNTSGNIVKQLASFIDSFHVEVQERASSTHHIMHSLKLIQVEIIDSTPMPESTEDAGLGINGDLTGISITGGGGSGAMFDLVQLDDALKELFEEVLKPVHPEAQEKVPIPSGLDLDQPFNSEECDAMENTFHSTGDGDSDTVAVSFVMTNSEKYAAEKELEGDDDEFYNDELFAGSSSKSKKKKKKGRNSDGEESPTAASSGIPESNSFDNLNTRHKENDPFMLGSGGFGIASAVNPADINVDSIPMVTITDDDLDVFDVKQAKVKKGKKGNKAKKKNEAVVQNFQIISEEILPEGATLDDSKKKKKKGETTSIRKDSDDMDIGDIDITTPLEAGEVFHTQRHHEVSMKHFEDPVVEEGKKKKKSKKGKEGKKDKTKKATKVIETAALAPALAVAQNGQEDLLDFMSFDPIPVMQSQSVTVTVPTQMSSVEEPAKKKKSKKTSSEKSDKKEKKKSKKKKEKSSGGDGELLVF